ncbi:putative kelch motif containing protein [Lyophyllum shimeji]|uniref:Kelch motif containing protein n=1 Tax=Lyophyllum shimeji TaxID=47721 RepID=A0A9P3PLI0_LYOSH|nr:putative kelch motif containing protein [Lyophyllum shimeji]
MLHSIYDLTTFCRKTTGDVPAKLVGASTTVVGSKMYLFGGRLVTERKMVSDLYVFDLETFNWEKVPISPEDDVPRARYFHSADTWNDKLIIFGGMSNQPDSINPDELCVLNDVRFFDVATRHWLPATQSPVPVPENLVPRARYAHLSSVTADRLFIIGGQDFNNTWLDDVCVYDLVGRTWVQRRDYPRHCGTYRSVAVSSDIVVRLPQEEMRNSQSASTLGPPGQRFGPDKGPTPAQDFTPAESLIHLPYSAPPSEDHPSDIYLYSNYNFTDVKRELELFSPLPDTDFTIQDKSSAMAGATFPPGLRFPTGAILGTNLIIAGTYLAHSYQSFSIWVLDLVSMTWSRIDPGKAVESGSWFRGSLWAEANKFIIFGNRNGNLVDDYNRRLLSWDHVAVVDLEAFGIYQPPPLKLDITIQELGLAALEERVVADFDIVCEDGRRISCSRRILEERWPWFLEQRKKFTQNVRQALEVLPESAMHVPLPELPGNASSEDPRVDPRLTARSLELSEPYPVVMALLQYFYTTALVTPLQHAPAVLSQLLVIAVNYGLDHLEALVKHAMHRALSNSTSVGVYEVATLCSCRSLQIRALKTVMSYTQKRPSRSRGDKDGKPPSGSSGGGPPANGPGGPGGPPGNDSQYGSRPRGTSDARWRHMGDSVTAASGYHTRNVADSRALVGSKSLVDLRDLVNHKSPVQPRETVDRSGAVNSRNSGDLRRSSDTGNFLDMTSSAEPRDVVDPRDIRERRMRADSQPILRTRPFADVRVDARYTVDPRSLVDIRDVVVPKPDSDEEDQITPLPVLRPVKSQRRSRSQSIVSIHTDGELRELADFMSVLADISSPRTSHDIPEESLEQYPSSSNPPTPQMRHASLYSSSNRDSSSAPSVAPSLSASVATLSYSDSDHYQSSENEHGPSAAYQKHRPPPIHIDSMHSVPPSLTSSASYSSSLPASRFTSPVTPLINSAESTSDHGLMGERYIRDPATNELESPGPIDMGFPAQDHPVKQWPQQPTNIRWAVPPPPPIPIPDPEVTPPAYGVAAPSTVSLALSSASSPPPTPRSGGFGRLLGRKNAQQDRETAPEKEKKKKEKKPKERKVKVETPEQRRERIRRERLQETMGANGVVFGAMMTLG